MGPTRAFCKVMMLAICLMSPVVLATPSFADFVYTYTGNSFTEWVNGMDLAATNVSGSLTYASVLPPSPTLTQQTPLAWSFTDGVFTWTQANSTCAALFSTDASGNILEWQIGFQYGPYSELDLYNSLITDKTSGLVIDRTMIGQAAQELATYALVLNNPGTWTAGASSPVPVPPSVLLLASGLIGMVAVRRRLKR